MLQCFFYLMIKISSEHFLLLQVTSDCTSEETSLVPTIIVDGDDITVTLGVGDGQDNMGFVQGSTRYETFWSYVYGFCGFDYFLSSTTEMNVALVESDAPAGSSGEQSFPTSSPLDVTQGTDGTVEAVESTTVNTSYESCGFDCCVNTDCDGCCIGGICQPNENEFDLCAEPPIKPGDGECGAVAFKAFQEDNNCPTGGLPGAEATVPGQDVTTTTSTTTVEMETASSSTVAAMIDQTSTSPEQVEPSPCVKGKCLNPEGVCEMAVICLNDPCQAENNGCGDSECTANYCGGCNVVCVGIGASEFDTTEATASPNDVAIDTSITPSPSVESSFAPSTAPSEKPTPMPTPEPVTAAPSSEPITTAPATFEPISTAPIQSVGVDIPSGPTQNLYPNPPVREYFVNKSNGFQTAETHSYIYII